MDRAGWLSLCVILCACTGASPATDGGTDLGGAEMGAIDGGAPDAAGHDGGPDLAGCDEDGDGVLSMACGGLDCDDHSMLRAPGHTEVCDVANVDEDCDPLTFGTRDNDMDGHVDAHCCNADAAGAMHCGDDCNDASSNIHPGATEVCNRLDDNCNGVVDEGAAATEPEVCNGVDDNCNGLIDEGVATTFYLDADGDGFGDPTAATMMGCVLPTGYTFTGTDCDDAVSAVHPGALEICDGIDNDCDGTIDPGCACTLGTSRSCGLPGRCAGATQTCLGGTWGACSIVPTVETCNGLDDDCDGVVDNGLTVTCYSDGDGDTYAPAGAAAFSVCPVPSRPAVGGCPLGDTNRPPTGAANSDCNDTSATAHPGAAEVCNGVDDDCNGAVDDGVSVTCYTDVDGDGYSPLGAAVVVACVCPVRMTTRAPSPADCDDSRASVHPAAAEICGDLLDNDCDGTVDTGCTCASGSVRPCPQPGVCAAGTQTCAAGMYGVCSISPTAETCNSLDDDCNGLVDDGITCP